MEGFSRKRLVHLKGLTKLTNLCLLETKITNAGEKDLQESLPGCKIIR